MDGRVLAHPRGVNRIKRPSKWPGTITSTTMTRTTSTAVSADGGRPPCRASAKNRLLESNNSRTITLGPSNGFTGCDFGRISNEKR